MYKKERFSVLNYICLQDNLYLNPNKHIFIYTHKITPRVKYTFNLILKDCLGLEFSLTNNIDDYKSFEGNKFSYTNQEVESNFHFSAHTLLFES